jgi:uncharacterized membrane protein (DUF441 family)
LKKSWLALLVGVLLMLWGVNGVTSMATRAVAAGNDGSVANNVYRMVLDNGVRTSRQAQNQTSPAEETPK